MRPRLPRSAGSTSSDVLRKRLSEAQRIARVGSWTWDVATDSVVWSDQLFRNYGLDPGQAPASFAAYLGRVHPEDRDRVVAAITQTIASLEPYEHDYRIVLPNGDVRVMHARSEVTARKGDLVLQLMGYCQDVTEQWEAEETRRQAKAELASHQLVLERIARGEPLEATLDLLCAEIEANYRGTLCSVLMVEPGGSRLRLVAAPSMSSAVRTAVDGLTVTDGGSVCGTAAARKERVIVEDTLDDPLTADFVQLATEHDLRSVWSEPLTDAGGEVVGTFAIYRSVRTGRRARAPRRLRPRRASLRCHSSAAEPGPALMRRRPVRPRSRGCATVRSSSTSSPPSLADRDERVAVMFLDLDGSSGSTTAWVIRRVTDPRRRG